MGIAEAVQPLIRHARPCAGHPRVVFGQKNVDGRPAAQSAALDSRIGRVQPARGPAMTMKKLVDARLRGHGETRNATKQEGAP
jgi:hypothetical protein